MIPAAVGFQCPSCVNDGRKSVRAPRTSFGGRISANPQQTTIAIIAINVVMWILTVTTGGNGSNMVRYLALTPKGTCQSLDGNGYFPGVPKDLCGGPGHWVAGALDGAPWQFITSAFMHVEPQHIALNMISLWFLGPMVEHLLGRARFIAVYAVSLITGSIAVALLSNAHTPTLGASGAIFGLLGALLILSRRSPQMFQQMMMWLVINLVFTFVAPGISWQGHIGGLIGGAAITAILTSDQFRTKRRQF